MSLERLALLLVCPLALALAGCGRDVVAEVGSRKVYRSDLDEHRRLSGAPQLPAAAALDAIIARERLANEAKVRGLADDEGVKARLRAAEREVLAQVLLERELEGITEAQAHERFKAKPEAFSTRRVHLAHLFFVSSGTADGGLSGREAAQSRANAAWARLLGGDDFAEVAKKSSEDVATAERGGDLGWVKEGEIAAMFFDAVVPLEQGKYTRPLESGFGFHIFRVIEPVEVVSASFDTVKGKLLAQMRRDAEAELIARLEKDVSVTRHPERLGEKESKR